MYKNNVSNRAMQTVKQKAFYVVLSIWLVTIAGSFFVYFKNQGLSRLSIFVNEQPEDSDQLKTAGQAEDRSLLFVRNPNKKLILTKFTGIDNNTVEQITRAGAGKSGIVIIRPQVKKRVPRKPDFFIQNVPK